MKGFRTLALCAVVGVAACDAPLHAPTAVMTEISLARAGGQTQYSYTLSGDVASPSTAPAATANARTGSPFAGVSVDNIAVTFGSPTGDIAMCKTGDGVYDTSFGQHAGITAVGTLTFFKTGTVSFLGTRLGGSETIQFSAADASGGAVVSPGPTAGSFTYALTDARLFFGGNSAFYDGKYRCVNITVTATP